MKKMMKKNHKGFSLVELIVVVLIMGIIAVALAPQVMKWVGTARTNSDSNTSKDIKNAVQVAYADYQSQGGTGTSFTFDFDSTGVGSISDATFKACVQEVSGGDYPTKSNGGSFAVTVTSGVVSVN